MYALLENSEKRQLAILSILYKKKSWRTVQSLAENLNCSVDVIYKDIYHINIFASENNLELTILKQKTKGVYLEVASHHPLNLFKSVTVKNSIGFKLLDFIFQNNSLTIALLTEHLFISKSTIYRKLREIETMFKKKNIMFNYSTFELSGSELTIREFFFDLYWLTLNSAEWPFIDISKQMLQHRIKPMENLLSTLDYSKLLYRLGVNFVRHQKKHFINHFKEQRCIDPIHSKHFDYVSHLYSDIFPKMTKKAELDYLLLIFITQSQHNLTKIDFAKVNYWHRQTNSVPFQLSQFITDDLKKKYPQETNSPSELVQFKLISLIIYAIAFKCFTTDRLPKEYRDFMYKDTPNFTAALQESLNQLAKLADSMGVSFHLPFLLNKTHLILRDVIKLESIENYKIVKLICTKDPLSEKRLAESLKTITSQHLCVVTETTENNPDLLPDLIISDLQLTAEKKITKTLYYTSTFPLSERDKQAIIQLLDL